MIAHAPTVKAAKKPLFLPARIVDRLTEACTAAECDGGAESFVEAVLGDIVEEFQEGHFHLILDAYTFGSEEAANEVKETLADLALRWRNEDKLHAEKEVCHE